MRRYDEAAVRSGNTGGEEIRGQEVGLHTFRLCHDSETIFAVLGGGHVGGRGRGSGSLGCSCHTLGW